MDHGAEDRLSPSELITDSLGRIYHLQLFSEEISDLILTVGDPQRVDEVAKHFDTQEFVREHREFRTITGTLGKRRMTVISTGIGTDNVDIVINELDALANIDFKRRKIKEKIQQLTIIRLGTSGGLAEDLPLDSFVASYGAIGLDGLMHFYDYCNAKTSIQPADAGQLAQQIENLLAPLPVRPYVCFTTPAMMAPFLKSFVAGLTVTSPGFYGPQGRQLRTRLYAANWIDRLSGITFKDHKITNFEMETAGIYGLCQLLGHRYLSLSAIIAQRRQGAFSVNAEKCVDKMITTALDVILSNGI